MGSGANFVQGESSSMGARTMRISANLGREIIRETMVLLLGTMAVMLSISKDGRGIVVTSTVLATIALACNQGLVLMPTCYSRQCRQWSRWSRQQLRPTNQLKVHLHEYHWQGDQGCMK
jgi:hypothetical protein